MVSGFIILENNDTIAGELKDKKLFSTNRVKLFQHNNKTSYPKRRIKEITVSSDRYVKSDHGFWSTAFFRKEESGNVNLYTYRNRKYLGAYDSDINFGRLAPSLKFYCDDYPFLRDTVRKIDKGNIDEFIGSYNEWKTKHPGSKSYFETNIYTKPAISFKVSFLLPGAGFEIGLSEKFSLSTMLKNEFGYGSSVGWILNPFIDNQLRYYHNMDKRKSDNKRTYKYSGNYICFVQAFDIQDKSNFLGFEYGWQRTVGKHWYYNIGLGIAKWTTGSKPWAILHDFDFGYNF